MTGFVQQPHCGSSRKLNNWHIWSMHKQASKHPSRHRFGVQCNMNMSMSVSFSAPHGVSFCSACPPCPRRASSPKASAPFTGSACVGPQQSRRPKGNYWISDLGHQVKCEPSFTAASYGYWLTAFTNSIHFSIHLLQLVSICGTFVLGMQYWC